MSVLWQDDWYGILGEPPTLSDEECDILDCIDIWESQTQGVSCTQVWNESLYDESEVVLATRWRSTKKREKTIWDSLEYSPGTSGVALRESKAKATLARMNDSCCNHGMSNIIPFPEPATSISGLAQFARFYAYRSLLAGAPLKPDQFHADELMPDYLPLRNGSPDETYTFEEVVSQALKEDPEFKRSFETAVPRILQEVTVQEEERRREAAEIQRVRQAERRQQEEEAKRRAMQRLNWQRQQEEALKAKQEYQRRQLEEAKARAYAKAAEERRKVAVEQQRVHTESESTHVYRYNYVRSTAGQTPNTAQQQSARQAPPRQDTSEQPRTRASNNQRDYTFADYVLETTFETVETVFNKLSHLFGKLFG